MFLIRPEATVASADPALRGSAYPADGDAANAPAINAPLPRDLEEPAHNRGFLPSAPATDSEDVESLSCWPNCGGPGYGKPRATDSSVDKKPPVVNGQ